MEYNLKIGKLNLPVIADLPDDGTLSASVGNETYAARNRRISDNQIHMELDGRSLCVYVVDLPDGKLINIEGTSYLIEDADSLARKNPRKRAQKEGTGEITPPMPSVVVRILVVEGERVEKDQGIIVVAAMKMEATLCASYNGIVLKVNVSEGDKVMPGRILVDIKKEEAEIPQQDHPVA